MHIYVFFFFTAFVLMGLSHLDVGTPKHLKKDCNKSIGFWKFVSVLLLALYSSLTILMIKLALELVIMEFMYGSINSALDSLIYITYYINILIAPFFIFKTVLNAIYKQSKR